jgi:hypothetical protein
MPPDGLNRLEITGNVNFYDGVTSRSIMTRLESYLVVANTNVTNLTVALNNKPLAPSMLTRTFFPWRDLTVGMATELPLSTVSGNNSFQFSFAHSGRTGANVTSVTAAIDPAYVLKPTPYGGYPLVNLTATSPLPSSPLVFPVTASIPVAVKCVKGGGDAGSASCTATLNPRAVPRDCLFNPCAGGLCDGLHRLTYCTHSFVDPSNPMFAGLAPDGQVGAGTLTSCVVAPITTSNSIVQDSTCVGGVSSAPAAARLAGPDGADAPAPEPIALAPEVRSAFTAALGSQRATARANGGVNVANALFKAEAASIGRNKARLVIAKPKLSTVESNADDDAARALVWE